MVSTIAAYRIACVAATVLRISRCQAAQAVGSEQMLLHGTYHESGFFRTEHSIIYGRLTAKIWLGRMLASGYPPFTTS